VRNPLVRNFRGAQFSRAHLSVRNFPGAELSVRIFPCATFPVRIFLIPVRKRVKNSRFFSENHRKSKKKNGYVAQWAPRRTFDKSAFFKSLNNGINTPVSGLYFPKRTDFYLKRNIGKLVLKDLLKICSKIAPIPKNRTFSATLWNCFIEKLLEKKSSMFVLSNPQKKYYDSISNR
jgi:hypothetical protein